MTTSAFSATNLVTHVSSPVGIPATRSPFVNTPTSIEARSEKDCWFAKVSLNLTSLIVVDAVAGHIAFELGHIQIQVKILLQNKLELGD